MRVGCEYRVINILSIPAPGTSLESSYRFESFEEKLEPRLTTGCSVLGAVPRVETFVICCTWKRRSVTDDGLS